MNFWLLTLAAVQIILLGLVRLLKPVIPESSDFELSRRHKLGDERARREQERTDAAPTLWGIRRVLSGLLLLGIIATSVALAGWGWTVLIVVVLVLLAGYCERDWRFARNLYKRLEQTLLRLAENKVIRFLPVPHRRARAVDVGSTEELMHIIAHASFLDPDERELVRASLEFPHLRVKDVMRPKSALHQIDKGELLGPLVIDGLYKTGESVFLVTDQGIDTVIGLLPLDKLTGLELTSSPNALNAMDDTVEFIGENALISDALQLLRSSGTELLIVRDDDGHTVGGISLGEITDRLFN